MYDLLPHIFAIFVVYQVTRGACKSSECFRTPSCYSALVVTVYLSPCLFNEEDPQLESFTLREARFKTILPAREIVIHYDVLKLSIHAHSDHVTARIILVVCLEDFFNALRELSNSGYC